MHTASLLHDDVVDEAKERRGNPSVYAQWGNKTAILSGDYLLAASFMGALGRVGVSYTDLPGFLMSARQETPVYGTFLGGDSIYASSLPDNAIIVMGNEGNGISEKVADCIDNRLEIPSFSNGTETSESLNVAVATAVVCSEFRRRSLTAE